MRYWPNWRCENEAGFDNGATRPPLEYGPVGYGWPESLGDKFWSRPQRDGYVPGFSEPAADLPRKGFNYWRFIKWFRWGLPDLALYPSTPGMSRPAMYGQADIAKALYQPPLSGNPQLGPNLMEDWGGLVLICGEAFSGQKLENYTHTIFAVNVVTSGTTYEVRVFSPTPNNYENKTIRAMVNGQEAVMDVGFVGAAWKTLGTYDDVTTFQFIEQSSP